MPFDVLPSHNIRVPQVQFQNIPWAAYAQMQIEAARERYGAMLKGMDEILKASDPLTMAQRRLALAQARYQEQLLPMELRHFQQYGFGLPKTAGEAMQERAFQNQENQRGIFNRFKGGDGSDLGHYGAPSGATYDQSGTATVVSPGGKTSVTVGPVTTDDESQTGTQGTQDSSTNAQQGETSQPQPPPPSTALAGSADNTDEGAA